MVQIHIQKTQLLFCDFDFKSGTVYINNIQLTGNIYAQIFQF
jgi:hypothetical protein